MLVDRAYNDIVREVNPEERRLVVDPIRQLDRGISQGMTKVKLWMIHLSSILSFQPISSFQLTWQNKGMKDRNLREGLLHELSGGRHIHAVGKEEYHEGMQDKIRSAQPEERSRSAPHSFFVRVDKQESNI